MIPHKTAGELSLKAAADKTKYNPLDVADGLVEDIPKQIEECIQRHLDIFDEDEFCVVMVIADDNLLKNVRRRKFYAWPYLPQPRPNQAVFLYSKKNDQVRRLWVLPKAETMAILSTLDHVNKEYQTMKNWSDAFFDHKFWEYIREEHKIDMLSEHEYLKANREKLIEAGCKETDTLPAEAFDFSKVNTEKVVDSSKS